MQDPGDLLSLASWVRVWSLEARRAGRAVDPVLSLQNRETAATWSLDADIGYCLLELLVDDKLPAVCHVHQSGIGGGCQPCRQEEYSISQAVEGKEGQNDLEAGPSKKTDNRRLLETWVLQGR